MVLTRGGGGEQPNVTITPSQPVPPTEQPTAEPTGQPTTQEPQPTPTGTSQPPPVAVSISATGSSSHRPTAGRSRRPARTWRSCPTESVFLGQSLQISQSTNPAQLCDAWHRNVAEGTSNGKFQDPEDAEVGTTRLKAATCVAEVTVSGGQGTTKLFLFSLASVRQSDGVTVMVPHFRPNADTAQLNTDFTSMINSMLKSQTAGGWAGSRPEDSELYARLRARKSLSEASRRLATCVRLKTCSARSPSRWRVISRRRGTSPRQSRSSSNGSAAVNSTSFCWVPRAPGRRPPSHGSRNACSVQSW